MGGTRGKTSLTNTTDTDILEYIWTKVAARIVVKSRTFLVKVKVYRGEPLNEGADDLTETCVMEKEGNNFMWKRRGTTSCGKNEQYVWCTHTTIEIWDNGKKDTWTKVIHNTTRRGVTESLLEE